MILWASSLKIAQFFHKFIAFAKVTNLVARLNILFHVATAFSKRYNMVKMQIISRSYCPSANMTNVPVALKNTGIAYLFKRHLHLSRTPFSRTGICLSRIISILTPFSFSFSLLMGDTPLMAICAFYTCFFSLFAIEWEAFFILFLLALLADVSMTVFLTLVYSKILNRFFNLASATWFRENKKRPLNISYLMASLSNICQFPFTSFTSGSMTVFPGRLFCEVVKRLKYAATCTNFRQYIHNLTPLVSPCIVVLPERQGYAFSRGLITPMLGNKSILSFFAASVKPEMEAA